jgi:anti-sigma factor RsiW
MRCHEVRALYGVYNDSELDPKTTCKMEGHLEVCAQCRSYIESEWSLESRIEAVLRGGEKDAALWHKIESGVAVVTATSERSWWNWKGTSIGLGIAAALVIGVIMFIDFRTDPFSLRAISGPLASHHASFVAGAMSAQFVDVPPPEELDLTKGRLDRRAFTLVPSSSKFEKRGARLCHIEGTPVAWIMGRSGDKLVSVVAMRAVELALFPALSKRLADGNDIACFNAGAYEIGARRVDEHVVCLIGDVPHSEVESLLASISVPD